MEGSSGDAELRLLPGGAFGGQLEDAVSALGFDGLAAFVTALGFAFAILSRCRSSII